MLQSPINLDGIQMFEIGCLIDIHILIVNDHVNFVVIRSYTVYFGILEVYLLDLLEIFDRVNSELTRIEFDQNILVRDGFYLLSDESFEVNF